MNYVDSWVSYYLPKTPEPPSSERKRTVYISDGARRAVLRAKAKAGAPKVAAVPHNQESDDVVDLLPLPAGSPRGSPRVSPRASPRGSPRGSPRESPQRGPHESPRASPRSPATAPEAHGGRLEEPTEMPVRMRGSPRRQQQQLHGDDNANDDDDADRIGALDNATARVMVRPSSLHCVPKNDTDVTHYRFNPHQPISLIFGRDAADRVCY